MRELETLITSVEGARSSVIAVAQSLTPEQGVFKERDAWSIAEVVEHLYLAELFGVSKIWVAVLALRLDGYPLDDVVFPHFLSGPLDARQRLQFLRYHMERHLAQIDRIRGASGFPR